MWFLILKIITNENLGEIMSFIVRKFNSSDDFYFQNDLIFNFIIF